MSSGGGGHYIAYSRYNGRWWRFDDSDARKINDNQRMFNDGSRTLLVYEAIDNATLKKVKDTETSSLAMYAMFEFGRVFRFASIQTFICVLSL